MKGRDIETGRSKGKGKIIMEILTEKPEKLEALKRAVVETAKKAYREKLIAGTSGRIEGLFPSINPGTKVVPAPMITRS